jgi:phage FluMu protein Com
MGSSRVEVKCPKCGDVFLPSKEETQSRAGKSARRKGHAFERRVAKQLQDWWNQDREQKCEMKRCPQSGGSVLKTGFRMFGDVVCNALDWKFGVECKNVPGSYAGLHQFISAPKFVFWDWVSQATGDCPSDVISLIIFTRYDQPTFCATIDPRILNRLAEAKLEFYTFYARKRQTTIWIWNFDDMLGSLPNAWKDENAQ